MICCCTAVENLYKNTWVRVFPIPQAYDEVFLANSRDHEPALAALQSLVLPADGAHAWSNAMSELER